MVKQNGQSLDLLGWMGSLADATRLRLLRLLERHEVSVADLCDALQMPQSTVSRHLKVLTDQGWTRSRRQGTTNRYYMPTTDLSPATRRLWQLAREQTGQWPTLQQDELRLERCLRDRRQGSQTFFADAAEQWEKLRRDLYGDQFSDEALIALLPGDWTIADLGCGTGPLTERLAQGVGRVIGVDNSAAMLKAARSRLREHANVELHDADLTALPLDDASCDAAVMVLVLTYLEEPGAAVAEMARIVRPGGKAVVVDLLRHDRPQFRREMNQVWPGFECDELNNLLADAGLTAATCSPLPPQPQAKGPALILATASKPG